MAEVQLLIKADTRQAQQAIAGFTQQAQASLATVSSAFASIKGFAAGAVAVFAGNAVINALTDATNAAANQEKALNALNVALGLAGNYSKKASDSFVEFAEAVQTASVYEDDAVLSSAALIENITKLDTEALKGATQGAVDLAAAMGMDLETAAVAVAKAIEGNTLVLSKYGISVQKGKSDSEQFANVMKALQGLSGSAAGQLNTFAGAVTHVGHAYGDMQEAAGDTIIQNKTVVASLKGIGMMFDEMKKSILSNSDGWKELISGGIIVAVEVLKVLNVVIDMVVRSLTVMYNAWTYQLKVLSTSLYALIAGPLWLLSQGLMLVGKVIPIKETEQWAKTADAIAAKFGKDLKSIGRDLGDIGNAFTKPTDTAQTLSKVLNSVTDEIARATASAKDFNRNAPGSDTSGLDRYADEFTKQVTEIDSAVKNAGKSQVEVFKGVEQERIGLVIRNVNLGLMSQTDAERLIARIKLDSAEKIGEAEKKIAEEVQREELKRIKEVEDARKKSIDTIAAIFSSFASGFTEMQELTIDIVGERDKAQRDLETGLSEIANDFKRGLDELSNDIVDARKKFEDDLTRDSDRKRDDFEDIKTAIATEVNPVKRQALIDELARRQAEWDAELLKRRADFEAEILEKKNREEAELKAKREAAEKDLMKKREDLELDLQRKIAEEERKRAEDFDKSVYQSATNFISTISGKLVDVIAPGFGQIIQPLISLLSQTPEQITQFVTAFMEAVPAVIENMIQSMPALIFAIIESLPKITAKFFELMIFGVPKLILSMIAKAPEVITSMINEAPKVIWEMVKEVGASFKEVITEVVKMFLDIPKDFFNALLSLLNKIPGLELLVPDSAVPGGDSGDGGITLIDVIAAPVMLPIKAVDEVLSWFGLAKGGTVPTGFSNDSFPAKLSSGEMVIPRNDVQRLQSFLDREESPAASAPSIDDSKFERMIAAVERSGEKSLTLNLKVGERELANVLLALNRQGFRTV